jgi:hypothetical protein
MLEPAESDRRLEFRNVVLQFLDRQLQIPRLSVFD